MGLMEKLDEAQQQFNQGQNPPSQADAGSPRRPIQ